MDYLLRDLLNEICKRFPAEDSSSQDGKFVRVSCTWGSQEFSAFKVSTDGFLMLEAAEGAMGSTEQNLELVVVKNLVGPLLSAVGSRLAAPLPSIPSLLKVLPILYPGWPVSRARM